MEDVKFKSLEEVFTRLLPALTMSKNELKAVGIIVSEKEIWLYLKQNIWQYNKDLHLYDMVNDIFNIEKEKLISFLRVGDKNELR